MLPTRRSILKGMAVGLGMGALGFGSLPPGFGSLPPGFGSLPPGPGGRPPAPRPPDRKPLPKGVFTRQSVPSAASVFEVGTIAIAWHDIEGTPGTYDWRSLRSQLRTAKHRKLRSLRVRPMLGIHAPDWAKRLGDGPIPYVEPQSGKTGTIPDLWSLEFQDAAALYLSALADEIDHDELVGLVFATGGMTWYGEPFIRGIADAGNRQALLRAGYTINQDLALQRRQLGWMTPFSRTSIGLAYNPLQQIRVNGTATGSVVAMAEIMDYHIALFGQRAVLQNNSIRSSYIGAVPPMYEAFRRRPQVEHQFQTAAAWRVGDEEATIRWAKSYLGASGVEGAGTLTNEQYEELDALLKA